MDATHGPHQVAQMSTRTSFPRKSESFIVLPSGPITEKSGAMSPALGPGRVVEGAPVDAGTVAGVWA
jgi:hypothetical protein